MIAEPHLPIFLGLWSAFFLAAASTAVKAGQDILMARVILAASAGLMIAPASLVVPLPNSEVIGALFLSSFAHGLYQLSTIRAMHRGDLSVVFPIMRGTAPILVAFAAMLLIGERLSPLSWLGLVIATCGVFAFSVPNSSLLKQRPTQGAIFWSFMTAIGIALYSVTDTRGVRLAEDPLTFIVWLFLFEAVWMTVVGVAIRRKRFIESAKKHWRYGVVAGAGSILSFGALLLAMDMTEAAKASALRETAIVFTAFMAWMFLGEPMGKRRVLAASIISAGLLVLQVS